MLDVGSLLQGLSQEGLLEEIVLHLDWPSLLRVNCLCKATHRTLDEPAVLSTLASARGLAGDPCICIPSLAAFAAAAALQTVSTDVFFERASPEVRADSAKTVSAIAALCRRIPGLAVYVSAHCGRAAPESIKKSFTQDRAVAVCQDLVDRGLSASTRMFVFGCGSTVTARDIDADGGRPKDYSKAELRVEFRTGLGLLRLAWGREWWLAVPNGPALSEPDWLEWAGLGSQ